MKEPSFLRVGLALQNPTARMPIEQVSPAGNTSLLGAKLALFSIDGEEGSYTPLRQKIEHVALKADAKFQEVFVDGLAFP